MSQKSLFISYASEDADAAQRMADALRAFGVNVWFDRSELRGGDTWDAKIKQQIRTCDLFVPVISARTQARPEGYFRREWNLAAERTLDRVSGSPFLLPVCIDDTPQAEALVPEAFTRVQWTRLPLGVATTQWVDQVRGLLQDSAQPPSTAARGPVSSGPGSRATRRWPALMGACAVLLVGGILALKGLRTSAPSSSPPGGVPVVVLMDSTYHDRVYDPATLASGGSNADDITDLLRDVPVRIIKEATSSLWRREEEVVQDNPSLVIIHRSCFITFPERSEPDKVELMDNKLIAFLGYLATVNPRTKFIVYSRHSWEDAVFAAQWRDAASARFPALKGRIETWRVPLDRATFRNPLTGQELKDSALKQLGLAP